LIDLAAVQNLIASWWFDYDQGNFELWPRYFTADAHFTCQSDSGATDYEVKKSLDHSDDLTHDIVFDRLLADLRSRGVDVAEPTDPLCDQDFIRALIGTYTIGPTSDWATPLASGAR
jgi:hypothetical protein